MRIASVLLIAAFACGLTGCAGFFSAPIEPSQGWVYSDISAPLSVVPGEVSADAKVGRASTKCYLGWVATGDASVKAAADSAGITKVQQIDYRARSYFGIFSEFTTIVYGE